MATLITHIRVADLLLDNIENISPLHFIMGSIAPDLGGTPQITHWTPTGEKDAIRSQNFFDEYVKNETSEDKKAFYLGYYVHLMTDILWWNYVWIPASVKFQKEIEQDRGFIKTIKNDWKYADLLFFYGNKDFRAFNILEKAESFKNVYLDYYPENIFDGVISNIYNSVNINSNSCNLHLMYDKISDVIKKIVCEIKDNLNGQGSFIVL